jgi:hypothetical protein
MKHMIFAITILYIASFVACATPMTTPLQTPTNNATEEAEIRNLVENFGRRLQTVSVQSPNAAQDMQKQYSEFVTPILLEMWISDTSKAPGRIVSSPWPDRIEITNLSKEESDRFMITGFVIEVTSQEIVNDGAAAKIPVYIIVQREQSRWLITEYVEEQ